MNNKSNLKKSKENKLTCAIEGLISSDFIPKIVNGKTIYQGKIFLNNYNLKSTIINSLKEQNPLIADKPKYSNLVVVSFWNSDTYEQYKDYLQKGVPLEIYGILKYKIYSRLCGGEKLQLFFTANTVFKVKEPMIEYNEEVYIKNRIPQIVYSQF